MNRGDILLSSSDRIFLGEGLIETLRVSQGQPCFAEQHWQRLKKAANALEITFDLSLSQWQDKLNECINSCHLYQGGIKVLLSGGMAARGLSKKGSHPQLVFEAFQFQPCSASVRLITAPWRRDAGNPVYGLKSVNYLEGIMASRLAEKRGANDVLFFNIEGNAMETSIASLFVIHKKQLITPSLQCGVLNGITRARILGYARQTNIPCSEEAVGRELIAVADAMFTCNSLQGIRVVSSLDDLSFQTQHPVLEILKALVQDNND